MQPIRDLLNRIRWDEAFGRGAFSVGFWDRIEERMITVSFRRLHFPDDDHSCFELTDVEGIVHRIPLHRVYEVYRDGVKIWCRHRR